MGSRAYAAVAVDINLRTRSWKSSGRTTVVGDATDPEFWSRAHGLVERLQSVLLTMSSHEANVSAVERLRARGFNGRIAATSTYPDQARQLSDLGVEFILDVYAEAGAGFVADLKNRFKT